MIVQADKKCRIPKKIKWSLSKINVTDVINAQKNKSIVRRFINLDFRLPERYKSLADIPEIIIKLAPTNCANNSGKPWIIFSNSMKLK